MPKDLTQVLMSGVVRSSPRLRRKRIGASIGGRPPVVSFDALCEALELWVSERVTMTRAAHRCAVPVARLRAIVKRAERADVLTWFRSRHDGRDPRDVREERFPVRSRGRGVLGYERHKWRKLTDAEWIRLLYAYKRGKYGTGLRGLIGAFPDVRPTKLMEVVNPKCWFGAQTQRQLTEAISNGEDLDSGGPVDSKYGLGGDEGGRGGSVGTVPVVGGTEDAEGSGLRRGRRARVYSGVGNSGR